MNRGSNPRGVASIINGLELTPLSRFALGLPLGYLASKFSSSNLYLALNAIGHEKRFWVFCDGTPHDEPAVKADDENKRQAIMAHGDEVWVYYYKDNLAEIVAARPDIFRKVR